MLTYALILFIVGGYIAYRAWQGGELFDDFEQQDAGQQIPLPDPRTHRHDDTERTGFGAIRHADPRFDIDTFYGRVSEMFLAYHAALAAGDLKPARRFVDERYYADLLVAMDDKAAPAGSEPLRVLKARAMTASHEAGMDTVRVLISAAHGAAETPSLQEYWTLIRRQGAITKADLSLYKCPNCGAPTDGDDPTRCGYCGARLADPALDWVVSQIRVD